MIKLVVAFQVKRLKRHFRVFVCLGSTKLREIQKDTITRRTLVAEIRLCINGIQMAQVQWCDIKYVNEIL